MHAAEAAERAPVARQPEPTRGPPKPRRPDATAATTDHPEDTRARAFRVDLARRRVMRADEVIDRVRHPLLGVAGHVVDAVGGSPSRKRADGSELVEPIAVVGLADRARAEVRAAMVGKALVVE